MAVEVFVNNAGWLVGNISYPIALPSLLDLSSGMGLMIFHCAQLYHPPTHWHAETCH
jgi:hypothetical protein